MASRFWVGGTGNWNQTAHWSATSGGASGAAVPTAADDVFFDANSGAGTCTITASTPCRSLQSAGSAIATLVHNAAVTLTIGDATAGAGGIALDLSGFTTYTLGNATSSAITFVSTSATVQTVNFAGKTTGNVTFDGAGGSWRYVGAHNTGVTGIVNLTRGSLDTNGQTCSWGFFSSNNSNTRSFTAGASIITLTTGGTAWTFSTTTGLTLDMGTSTLIFTGAAPVFSPGQGKAYNDVTFSGAGGTIGNTNVTIANLTRLGTASKTDFLTLSGDHIVTGTLTVTGNSTVNRVMVQSSVIGTPRTLTAGAVSLANVDFMDVVAGGAAAPWTGTSLGNALGNSGITFAAPVTRYAVAAGNWSSTATWAAASGGAPGASVPLPHDSVFLDVFSGAWHGVITMDMPRAGKDIDCTGYVGTLDWGGTAAQLNGSFTLAPGMTFTPGSSLTTFAGRGTHTITSAGKTFGPVTISAPGYYGLQDALTSSGRLTHAGGTLDTNAFNVTCSDFTISGAIPGTILDMGGGGVWTITWAGANGTVFTTNSANVGVRNARETEIVISAASPNTRTINTRFHALGTLTYTVAGSTGVLVVQPAASAAASFKRINVGPGRTLRTTSALELQVAEFNVNGAAGDLTTLDSSIAGSAHLLRTPGALRDLSGNGWHSTYGGGLAFGRADGIPGGLLRCPDFDGVDDETRLPGFNPYALGSQRTFMGWANRDTDGANDALLGGSSSNTFLRCTTSSRNVQFAPESGNTATFTNALPSLAPTGWFHWCLRYDDATGIVELLINGVSLGTVTLTPLSYDLTPGDFTIGARLGTDEFDGGIAGVSVHDGFVPDATVAALAASQSYTDDVLATDDLLAYWPLDESPQVVSCDYLSIKDSNAAGGSWYAGNNSTNVSNNSGWVFTNPPVTLELAPAAGQGGGSLALTAPASLELASAVTASGSLALAAPASLALAVGAVSAGSLALSAPTTLALGSGAATAVGSLALSVPVALALSSAGVGTASLAVITPTNLLLALSAALAVPTLALTIAAKRRTVRFTAHHAKVRFVPRRATVRIFD